MTGKIRTPDKPAGGETLHHGYKAIGGGVTQVATQFSGVRKPSPNCHSPVDLRPYFISTSQRPIVF